MAHHGFLVYLCVCLCVRARVCVRVCARPSVWVCMREGHPLCVFLLPVGIHVVDERLAAQ